MEQTLNLTAALLAIDPTKRAAVAPMLEEVFAFYQTIRLDSTEQKTSRFLRDVAFQRPLLATPLLQISTSGDRESALVHELLHLYLPLRYHVYALWFPNLSPALNELSTLVQNVVEHDLMIGAFLDFGYDIRLFMRSSRLNIDYKREKKVDRDSVYWLNEYLRHLISMQHLPKDLQQLNRTSMTQVRTLALNQYPALDLKFKQIREWFVAKQFHQPEAYPAELQRLFAIFGVGTPHRYLTPSQDKELVEKSF